MCCGACASAYAREVQDRTSVTKKKAREELSKVHGMICVVAFMLRLQCQDPTFLLEARGPGMVRESVPPLVLRFRRRKCRGKEPDGADGSIGSEAPTCLARDGVEHRDERAEARLRADVTYNANRRHPRCVGPILLESNRGARQYLSTSSTTSPSLLVKSSSLRRPPFKSEGRT